MASIWDLAVVVDTKETAYLRRLAVPGGKSRTDSTTFTPSLGEGVAQLMGEGYEPFAAWVGVGGPQAPPDPTFDSRDQVWLRREVKVPLIVRLLRNVPGFEGVDALRSRR